jgi:hypothetical protein
MEEELRKIFSNSRLGSYFIGDDEFSGAYERYQWNIKLCEAMLPSLSYLEIILRNQIDSLICKHFGHNWLINRPGQLMLNDSDKQKIEDNIQHFIREYKRNPNHNDLIAQMNFGFWCAFFHKRYDTVLWHRKHAIIDVFPALSRDKRTRRYLEKQLFFIKKLRNRIAHHEPIWNINPSVQLVHAECHALIGAMSPIALEKLIQIDRMQNLSELKIHGITASLEAVF